MWRRMLVWCVPVVAALGIVAGIAAEQLLGAGPEAMQELKPAVSLPLSRVVLFNSGVGYFSRSGEVTDDARVDLMFQEHDVNDLLKSMVLEDFGKGRIAAVSYDSREPISRTLSSFAINLNNSPTFAGIVEQMRGERVEVTISPGAANQPGKLSGTIVSVEKQKIAQGGTQLDVEALNLWCAEGLRSVRLQEVQQLRFANPVIESEFRRALDVLASSHDSQKKAVSLHFAGEGKRTVQVGYVVEAPIWKTSYRLVLADKEKPYLQGWAMVENTTDEDWSGVKMALVSGRPISFKMDLYNPLYVNRPTVEPELFASLRPVTYRGSMGKDVLFEGIRVRPQLTSVDQDDAPRGTRPTGSTTGAASPYSNSEGFARGGTLVGGAVGGLPAPAVPGFNFNTVDPQAAKDYAAGVGRELEKRMATGTVGNAATAASLGDFFQYTIDHPVSLARQKSAMLPIVGKSIEGQLVSIYNQFVQGTHPLLGLKFKNTSSLHLNQGPITVFEGSVYAGDTRVLDVQPNEERIVSYAIDQGMEVDPQVGPGTQKVTSVKAVKGIVTSKIVSVEEKKYRISNPSQTGRTLLIEHPNRTNLKYKLVETEKPVEDTPEFYRFQTTVKAGEKKSFMVKEQLDVEAHVRLSNSPEIEIRYFLTLTQITPQLKEKLNEVLKLRASWDASRQELKQLLDDLSRLQTDQDRIRKNLRETPKEAEVYGTYLKKLSDQEKELDQIAVQRKKLTDEEFNARKTYEEFLANISD